MWSHCDGEVWGLAVDINNTGYVVTSGDDNQIIVYDPVTRTIIAKS